MREPASPLSSATPPGRRGGYVFGAIMLAWVALMVGLSPAHREPVSCDEDRAVDADTLVMLSAAWCGYCRRARAYLQDAGIAHCEYDVETSAEGQRQFAALPVRVVPILKIRGDVLVGFNRTEIDQALIAHGLADFPD